MNKKYSSPATAPAGLAVVRKILILWLVSAFVGCALATQAVAAYYGYPNEFGLPLFYISNTPIYHIAQFFLWALIYPPDGGFLLGWIIIVGTIVTSSLITSVMWVRRSFNQRHDTAMGSAQWGDETDPKIDLYPPDFGVVLGLDRNGKVLRDARQTHIIITAATGAGKSTGPAICTLLSNTSSMIVADIKGELWEKTAGARSKFSDVHRFNPNDENPVTTINPLLEIVPGLSSIEDAKAIAAALVPLPERGETHWADKARLWLTSLILYTMYCETQDNRNLARLKDLAVRGPLSPGGFGNLLHNAVITKTEANKNLHNDMDAIVKYIRTSGAEILNTPDREAGSIVSTMIKTLDVFNMPQVARNIRHSTFRLRDLLYAKRPQTLYITAPPASVEPSGAVIRMLIEVTMRILVEKEPKRLDGKKPTLMGLPQIWWQKNRITRFLLRHRIPAAGFTERWPKLDRHNLLFLIDEARRYGKLDTVEKSIGLIRSYGGRIVFIAQTFSSLRQIYGKESEIFGNCGVKMFMKVAEMEDAQLVSSMLGKTTANYLQVGYSRQVTQVLHGNVSQQGAKHARDLLDASEVMRFSEAEGQGTAILIIAGFLPLKISKIHYFDSPIMLEQSQIPPPKLEKAHAAHITTDWDKLFTGSNSSPPEEDDPDETNDEHDGYDDYGGDNPDDEYLDLPPEVGGRPALPPDPPPTFEVPNALKNVIGNELPANAQYDVHAHSHEGKKKAQSQQTSEYLDADAAKITHQKRNGNEKLAEELLEKGKDVFNKNNKKSESDVYGGKNKLPLSEEGPKGVNETSAKGESESSGGGKKKKKRGTRGNGGSKRDAAAAVKIAASSNADDVAPPAGAGFKSDSDHNDILKFLNS